MKNFYGQSTLEVLIGLVIMVISVAAAIAIFFGGQSLNIDSELSGRAIYLARQELELAREAARQNFNSLASSSSTQDEFLKETVVEDIDANTKKVTSRVSWSTDPLRRQKIELVSYVTRWRDIISLPDPGDSGGGGISGNWRNPRTLGSIDLGPGNAGTDLDVVNKIVYMTAVASSVSKPDFFIIDATNGLNPVIVSRIDTGPGLNAVDATVNYAYVANNDPNAQLQVINISNIRSPYLVASFKLPGTSGNGAVGNSIFYANSKVYIGTKNANGPEFHIVDVSNPLNPIALGSKEINADVNAIYVNGSYAYLAVSSSDELKILDVRNPQAIVQIGNFFAPGDSEDGKSLYLVGNKLYLGRLRGGNHADHHEFHIVDVSNASSTQNLGSKDLAANLNDLTVRDNLAFFATDDSNEEFQVWDISNPANIAFWSSFNFPQVATGIDYEDNLVYVSVRSNDALRIITSSQ
jgi:hypothetical protein